MAAIVRGCRWLCVSHSGPSTKVSRMFGWWFLAPPGSVDVVGLGGNAVNLAGNQAVRLKWQTRVPSWLKTRVWTLTRPRSSLL